MTDEEEKKLADKSALKYFGKAIALVDVQKLGLYKDGFLAGLKAGRPVWHDLRKDPTDLPKEENRIMLCCCCKGYHGNIGAYVYRLYTKKEFHKVIAWCEIPTFDKE